MTERVEANTDLDVPLGLLTGLGLALFGSLLAQLFLLVAPALGAIWLLLFLAGVLWLHGKHRPTVALKEIRASAWLALVGAVPVTLVLGLGISGLIQTWAGPIPFPIPLPEGDNLLEPYLASLGGWATFALYAAVIGPVVEELAFRGWIQQSIGRRFGGFTGIVSAAFLFALFHLWYVHPAAIVLPFVLGVILGTAVHLTGSVRVAIVLHGAWNTLLMLIHLSRIDPAVLFYWHREDLGASVPVAMSVGAGIALGVLGYLYWRVSHSEEDNSLRQ